jgi:hypothetical protein
MTQLGGSFLPTSKKRKKITKKGGGWVLAEDEQRKAGAGCWQRMKNSQPFFLIDKTGGNHHERYK